MSAAKSDLNRDPKTSNKLPAGQAANANSNSMSTQQPESQSTTSTGLRARHKSQVVKSRPNERESKKLDIPDNPPSTTAASRQPPRHSNHDRPDPRSGSSNSHNNRKETSSGKEHVAGGVHKEGEQSRAHRSSVTQSRAPALPVKDSQLPPRVAEVTARGKAAQQPSAQPKPTNSQNPHGHLPENEEWDRMSDIGQSTQGPGLFQGIVELIESFMPLHGKYQRLKEDRRRIRDQLQQARTIIEKYERELKEKRGELQHLINQFQHERQRSKESIDSLENELKLLKEGDRQPRDKLKQVHVTVENNNREPKKEIEELHNDQLRQDKPEKQSKDSISSLENELNLLKDKYRRAQDELKKSQATIENHDCEMKEKNEELLHLDQLHQQSNNSIGSLENQLKLLENKYRQARDELKQAITTIGNHDRELKEKNEESQQLIDQLRVDKQQLKESIGGLENELKLKEEQGRTGDEMKQAPTIENGDHQLPHEKQQSKDSIGSLENELKNVRQQLKDAKDLAEDRRKELRGAEVFLTKADKLSTAEVGKKVTALNGEIFQAAATLGDALIHKRPEVSKEEDAAVADSHEMVGEQLTNFLIAESQKPDPEVNPVLAEAVLQIFIVNFCVSKIQSWFPSDPAMEKILTGIYSQIRSNEEQTVSGRWRALARAYTRPNTETWGKEIDQKLLSVLKIAAWAPRSRESEESFGQCFFPIFKAVNELRLAIGENFTSADLEITAFGYDTIYDPSIMDNPYRDDRQQYNGEQAPEAIVGTTGMGLKTIKAERGSKNAPPYQIVIPATILLQSTLHEAMEPVPTKRK